MTSFSSKLINWHHTHGRKDLPWQIKITPYKVWISEIMLQQTQVKTVIPYFKKFINRFSNVSQLADSEEEEVLALWTGLGYYSRAKNLHKTSKILKEDYNSKLPNSLEDLVSLPGIGKSTAGAIISLGFNKRAAILDGNVKRVLARHKNINGEISKTKTLNDLWNISEELLPKKEFRIYNQSLMDLGATICKKNTPLCNTCPVTRDCVSKNKNTIELIPNKNKRRKKPSKKVFWLLPYTESRHIYLRKRPPKGIWGSLWTFLEDKSLGDIINKNRDLRLLKESLVKHSSIKHSFSHYNLYAELYLIKSESLANTENWKNISQFNNIGLPKPVLSVLNNILENEKNSIL